MVLPLFLLQACVTSKGLTKKAINSEQSSDYTGAANLYYQALVKKRSNTQALNGLKRTGAKVLKDKLKQFDRSKDLKNFHDATYHFINAEAYQQKVQYVGIKLNIPEKYYPEYKEVKTAYLNEEYELGLKLIEQENFTAAEQKFNEIYKFDADFKNVRELRDIAFLEPIYRNAESLKNSKNYRKAYFAYLDILDHVSDYKDSRTNLEYVLKEGQINISLIKNRHRSRYSIFTTNIENYTENALINANDPFINIVDRENLGIILNEQDLNQSGLVDEASAVETGALSGAHYALTIEVTSVAYHETPNSFTRAYGYKKQKEEYFNESTQKNDTRITYKRVRYKHFSGANIVNLTAHIKIVSIETGKIILSNIIEEYQESFVNYIEYPRNTKRLFGEKDGKVNTSKAVQKELHILSKNPRHLMPEPELLKRIYDRISRDISQRTINKLAI